MKKSTLFIRLVLISISLLLLPLPVLTGCGKAPPSQAPLSPAPTSSTPAVTPAASTITPKPTPEKLTVLSISGGNVQVLKPGGSWKKGEEGMTLGAGDKIKTDAGGKASITFFEGSTVELQGDTEISLSELGFNADQSTTVRLKQELGNTISRAKKLADTRSRYEVETPAAVAAVRGTIMYVQVAVSGLTFVGNIEGAVAVVAQGIEIQLPENTHTNVVPGQPAGTPEPGATPLTPTLTTTPQPTSTTPPPSTSPSPTTTVTTTPPTTFTQEPPLTVRITSLQAGDLVGRTVTVSGVVSDPSVTVATFTHNGNSSTISLVGGSFSATVTLADGTNHITVSVTRGGQTASDSVDLVPEEATQR